MLSAPAPTAWARRRDLARSTDGLTIDSFFVLVVCSIGRRYELVPISHCRSSRAVASWRRSDRMSSPLSTAGVPTGSAPQTGTTFDFERFPGGLHPVNHRILITCHSVISLNGRREGKGICGCV